LRKIKITGNPTLQATTLQRQISLRTGRPFSASALNKTVGRLKKLYISRGFLNATIRPENFRFDQDSNTLDLDLFLDSGPFIYVDLAGASVPRKRLVELVPIYEEGSLDRDLINEGKKRLADYFQGQGFFDVKVKSEDPIEVPEQNAYQVNYTIERGEKQKVTSLEFPGMSHFQPGQITPSLEIRTAGWTHRGNFSEELLARDVETLRNLYSGEGFEQAQIEGRIEKDRRGKNLRVSFHLQEGNRTTVEAVSVIGPRQFSGEELVQALQLQPARPFSPITLEEDKRKLQALYEDRGFADFQLETAVERPQPGKVRLQYRVEEGASSKVGDLHVLGNELTRRKVITRNINFHEGYFFSRTRLLSSEQRLYNMGLFQRVNILPLNVRPPNHDRPVLIRVEDASPIVLAYGLGYEARQDYKGLQGLRGTFDISHNNLFGLARSLSFRATAGYRLQRGQITLKDPRLFNWEMEGLALIYAERERRTSFVSDRNNASLQILKKRGAADNFFLRYSYETVDLSDKYVNPLATGQEYLGKLNLSSFSTAWLRDTRDDPLDPQKGFFHTANFLVTAQAIGSEANYVEFYGQTQAVKKIGPGTVVATSFRLGLIEPFGRQDNGLPMQVPITERFFAGGPNTLRGFKLDRAGPLDPTTGNPVGGNAMIIGNVELRHLLTRNFMVAPFYDTGNVFFLTRNVRLSGFSNTLGLGFRYKTPFGPLRLDVGYNLDPTPGQKNPLLFFTIGNPF
jgi:outer membrane protein insertion porin family